MATNTVRKKFDPMASALSAIENASRVPAGAEDVRRILAGGEGEPSHVRALFGDVSLATLLRLAIACDIPDEQLARSYVRARERFAAANPELDKLAGEMGIPASD